MEGAVAFFSKPHLPKIERHFPPIYQSIPENVLDGGLPLMQALLSCHADSRQIASFIDLARFSGAIDYAYAIPRKRVLFHPCAYDEDVFSMQYEFLVGAQRATGHTKAMQLAALLYMSVFARQRIGPEPETPALVAELRDTLEGLRLVQHPCGEIRSHSMYIWMLFMGGVASPKSGCLRGWFRSALHASLKNVEGGHKFDVVRSRLQEILWISKLHEAPCAKLFREVQQMDGQSRSSSSSQSSPSMTELSEGCDPLLDDHVRPEFPDKSLTALLESVAHPGTG